MAETLEEKVDRRRGGAAFKTILSGRTALDKAITDGSHLAKTDPATFERLRKSILAVANDPLYGAIAPYMFPKDPRKVDPSLIDAVSWQYPGLYGRVNDGRVDLYPIGQTPATAAHEFRHMQGSEEWQARREDLYNARTIEDWTEAVKMWQNLHKENPPSEQEIIEYMKIYGSWVPEQEGGGFFGPAPRPWQKVVGK